MDLSDIAFPLHIASVVWSLVHVALADHTGFAWVRGSVAMLPEKRLRYYHRAVWAGLLGLIVSGFVLFWPMREFLLTSPAFLMKMGFVGALFINSFAIGALSRIASTKPARELTGAEAVPLVVSGGISGISWLGAFIAAFFLFN